MTKHSDPSRPFSSSSFTAASAPSGPHAEQEVTLRSPAELADALPYLLGFVPDDSIVMVALHGERGRFGGRLRLGIPHSREEWADIGDQLAETLLTGSNKRGARPDGVVLFLCQDPATGGTGQEVMERLRPLAQSLREACGRRDMPVFEALCLSGGRFWSYCCPDLRCCPREGTPLALPGTSVMAAAATYAGMEMRGSLSQLEARYAPITGPRAEEQQEALDSAAMALVPRILRSADCEAVREETLELARRTMSRFHSTPPLGGRAEADARDDTLLTAPEAATIIIGLQDRVTRDRAAEWMEGPEAPAALRLWRALARRCVPPYAEHGAAPVALAGWVAWSADDKLEARVALGCALRLDPEYLFAQLLHRACNEGLDPEPLRRCLRGQSAGRALCQAAAEEEARGNAAAAERLRTAVAGSEEEARGGGAGAASGEVTAARRRTGASRRSGNVRPGGPSGPEGRARTRRTDGQQGARSRQERPQ
ncbi:DUF4192 domain-containing protein [Streptomyces sp. UNOC14_S4]|uniref:DUF4192 domain-containing protein n=1 Tax=Streptomyces sp. UNOC14_S4 TaxID=2872340 RepID=UPI001E4A3F9F|nr:DUF4192 domain-containing protein [Streptomyces sp. UNOC14_S4]MCC3770557.1 DUF4192 domain-containing protein [Streptomyces sp. UNOC14_S4]